jgi:hypothetical protein
VIKIASSCLKTDILPGVSLFFGVVDPDPEVFGPSVSGSVIICTNPDPDPSKIEQKIKKSLDFYLYCFVTSL